MQRQNVRGGLSRNKVVRRLKARFKELDSSRKSTEKGDRVTTAVTKVGKMKRTGKRKPPPVTTTTKDVTNYGSDEDEVVKVTKCGRCERNGHSKKRGKQRKAKATSADVDGTPGSSVATTTSGASLSSQYRGKQLWVSDSGVTHRAIHFRDEVYNFKPVDGILN